MYYYDMERILFDQLVNPGEGFFTGFRRYGPGEDFPLHDHDFGEVMLIESGTGSHGTREGVENLRRGSLRFVRPDEAHSFRAGREGVVLLNCAFPWEFLTETEARLPLAPGYFTAPRREERLFPLEGSRFQETRHAFHRLHESPVAPLNRHKFLMDIYTSLEEIRVGESAVPLPKWLARALEEMERKENLAGGTERLFQLAGKTPEHTARTMVRYLGKTPSDLVTGKRMESAALLLGTSGLSVLEIALELGYANMSWFHRSFKKQYAMTPLQYRKRNLYEG